MGTAVGHARAAAARRNSRQDSFLRAVFVTMALMPSITAKKETHSAGGVVLNNKKEVLVVSQHGTSWSLPKGHIDEGENSLEAAKREIYEESGIRELIFIKDLGTYQRYKIAKDGGDDMSELKNITMYLFETTQTELAPVDNENPEAAWIKKEDVANLLTHEKDKAFFKSVEDVLG